MIKRGQEKSRKASICLGFTAFIGIPMASEHSEFVSRSLKDSGYLGAVEDSALKLRVALG